MQVEDRISEGLISHHAGGGGRNLFKHSLQLAGTLLLKDVPRSFQLLPREGQDNYSFEAQSWKGSYG